MLKLFTAGLLAIGLVSGLVHAHGDDHDKKPKPAAKAEKKGADNGEKPDHQHKH